MSQGQTREGCGEGRGRGQALLPHPGKHSLDQRQLLSKNKLGLRPSGHLGPLMCLPEFSDQILPNT